MHRDYYRLCFCCALVVACLAAALAQQPAVPPPDEDVVQLHYAPLPAPIGAIAVHNWFAVYATQEGQWSRWEVWEYENAAPTSWGHVVKNLQAPEAGVGGGDGHLLQEWRGVRATAIIAVLQRPEDYPYRRTYHPWPGPNSNTYIAWVLHKAKAPFELDPRAVGKDYHGLLGAGISSTRTGVQAECPVIGVTLGVKDGIELHILSLTLGIDFAHPALKTPFGRLGW